LIAGLLMVAVGVAKVAWDRKKAQAHFDTRLRCDMPPEPQGWQHAGMVWVPGGRFEMGDTEHPEELPVRSANVAGFWMDRTEVTNDAFAQFVAATGYVTVAERVPDVAGLPDVPPDMRRPGAVVFVVPTEGPQAASAMPWWRYIPGANWRHPGGPDTSLEGRGSFPAVALTIQDAKAYAQWKGRSLPTEMQWEWAARGGVTQAGLDHAQPQQANTWQGLFPVVNSADDGFVGLAPVGCFAPNAFGLFDMIGNVWELTLDRWTPNHQNLSEAATDPSLQEMPKGRPMPVGQHVIKGGSFLCAPNYCMRYRSGSRQPQDDDLGTSHLGFRTILVAPGP
jgi:formylglycine-generating enzyme required for sulfatase activity